MAGCKLHPDEPKKDAKKVAANDGGKDDKDAGKTTTLGCIDCSPWQRYFIYSIPLLLYVPWAIRMMKCPPRCCPPACCCPEEAVRRPRPKRCCREEAPRKEEKPKPEECDD